MNPLVSVTPIIFRDVGVGLIFPKTNHATAMRKNSLFHSPKSHYKFSKTKVLKKIVIPLIG